MKRRKFNFYLMVAAFTALAIASAAFLYQGEKVLFLDKLDKNVK